jgi:hypothetical protein
MDWGEPKFWASKYRGGIYPLKIISTATKERHNEHEDHTTEGLPELWDKLPSKTRYLWDA